MDREGRSGSNVLSVFSISQLSRHRGRMPEWYAGIRECEAGEFKFLTASNVLPRFRCQAATVIRRGAS